VQSKPVALFPPPASGGIPDHSALVLINRRSTPGWTESKTSRRRAFQAVCCDRNQSFKAFCKKFGAANPARLAFAARGGS